MFDVINDQSAVADGKHKSHTFMTKHHIIKGVIRFDKNMNTLVLALESKGLPLTAPFSLFSVYDVSFV